MPISLNKKKSKLLDFKKKRIFFGGIWKKTSYSLFERLAANAIISTPTLTTPRGVMVKAMDSGIVVSEFKLQSRYYVHFRANTLGKGMTPLILPAMG